MAKLKICGLTCKNIEAQILQNRDFKFMPGNRRWQNKSPGKILKIKINEKETKTQYGKIKDGTSGQFDGERRRLLKKSRMKQTRSIEVPGRRRSLTAERVKVLVKGLDKEILPVGAFVNAAPELPISLLEMALHGAASRG